MYQSDSYFDEQGNRQSQGDFSKYEINPYLEYGLSDSLTLGVNLFAQYLQQDVSETINFGQRGSITHHYTAENIGLTDSELFARQRLWQRNGLVISFQPLVKFPSLYHADHLPKGGSDSFDIENSLLTGYSFPLWDRYHFIDLRLGYRHRLDTLLNDQIKADAKLGIAIDESWYLIPAITYTHATAHTPQIAFAESGLNDYDLLKLECSVLFRVNPELYFSAGAFAHASGTNTGEGYGIMISTGWQLQ